MNIIKGLEISTINCGIKYKNRDDLLLIHFTEPANVAGVFTKSSMAAESVLWCKNSLKNKSARALIVNAGNANAFTGKEGVLTVKRTAEIVSKKLKCLKDEIFISSTGVIGEILDHKLIINGVEEMVKHFNNDADSWDKASKAIMTTDTKQKIISKKCKIGDKIVNITGFAKGSGMIAPNMATMLGYIFTDADIPSEILQKLLSEINEKTFNSITVDSDTSTNDTVLLFATKKAGNKKIKNINESSLLSFKKNLYDVMLNLAKMIVVDGEGAKKLIEVNVSGAKSTKQAKNVALAIANSPLIKSAFAAADPNWGRIAMAVGKSCFETSPQKILIKIGDYIIAKNGSKIPSYNEKIVHNYLTKNEVEINVDLGLSKLKINKATIYGCDLNEEYVKINKDYRT